MATNRMLAGMMHLKKRKLESEAVSIVYHRGNQSLTLTVWTGRTMFRVSDSDNTRVEWSDRDYFIDPDTLVFDSVKVIPRRGDWIEEVLPEPKGTERYELAAPENEQVFRWADSQHTFYRVHTKRMKGTP